MCVYVCVCTYVLYYVNILIIFLAFFKVQPGKGSAVLFYNLLEDGNGDDLALHAALPVNEGEKWLANFWVWDPKMRG